MDLGLTLLNIISPLKEMMTGFNVVALLWYLCFCPAVLNLFSARPHVSFSPNKILICNDDKLSGNHPEKDLSINTMATCGIASLWVYMSPPQSLRKKRPETWN